MHVNWQYRYSISQIIGVLLVTTGVILATLDNAKAHTEVIKEAFKNLVFMCHVEQPW